MVHGSTPFGDITQPAKGRTRPKRDYDTCQFAPEVNDVTLWESQPLVKPIIVKQGGESEGLVTNMIRSVHAGLQKGYEPRLTAEGTSGAYFMYDESGENCVGVFKPQDEEANAINNPRKDPPTSTDGAGLKRGTRVGEGAFREVAAYLLDHPVSANSASGFSGVPATALVQIRMHEQLKTGSLQMFVENEGSLVEMGSSHIPIQEVHKIAVMDIRLANADRHVGNILFHREEGGQIHLTPIDHGYCFPESFAECTFDWLYWRQAAQPFSADTIEYINHLDAERDINLLKKYGLELSRDSAHNLCVSTILLKAGATRGLTPQDIGEIMSRKAGDEESEIELILREAHENMISSTDEGVFLEIVSKTINRHLDKRFVL